MSAQSRPGFRRMALCVATGALVAATAAAPALAAGPDGPPPAPHAEAAAPVADKADAKKADAKKADSKKTDADKAEAAAAAANRTDYRGRVTARTGLLLRDRPTRSSRIVGKVPYKSVVHIFCKTTGDNVDGNNRWYLLTDGTWAWGSARYIENIGKAPRWC